MLFNSFTFVLFFLPLALGGYTALRLAGRARAAKVFLVAASLFFYGWWELRGVAIIVVSIAINYSLSLLMERWPARSRLVLTAGIVFNLGLLGWFKYYNFLAGALDALPGVDLGLRHIALPLAISFFTFQQIAYLVEAWRDGKAADSVLDYCLFVLFFPHLIAGPITHHKEMLPQFKVAGHGRLDPAFVTIGTVIFILGLAKKVVVADALAGFADPVFALAETGRPLAPAAAWSGALAYTFQLYFDFSGYSDMALGLGLLFGIRLPINFASPYKAASIIEFWRRWHISLSRFLRNYLYIPLGGNRHGRVRRYLNLFATMAIGGLWHGAGWTFLAWGALHGIYLMVNHAWRHAFGETQGPSSRAPLIRLAGWALTFVAVVFAWVPFRAASFHGALAMAAAMVGAGGDAAAPMPGPAALTVAAAALLAWLAPNTAELAGYPASVPGAEVETAPLAPCRPLLPAGLAAAALGAAAALALAKMPDPGIFLYFNF